MLVRWRYANDAANQGRGVYVDRVRVDGGRLDERRLTGGGVAAVEELSLACTDSSVTPSETSASQAAPAAGCCAVLGARARAASPAVTPVSTGPGW